MSRETHVSVTDSDVRFYEKSPGEASRLAYLGHVLLDNRYGLIEGEQVTIADGTVKVDAATLLVGDLGGSQRITLGADKGYDRQGFVQDLRDRNVTPHVARKRKGSAIDGRTTRHAGYAMSIHVCRRVESIFGWIEDGGWDAEDSIPWPGAGQPAFHDGCHRFQSGPRGATGGPDGSAAPRIQKMVGKYRKSGQNRHGDGCHSSIFDRLVRYYIVFTIFFYSLLR